MIIDGRKIADEVYASLSERVKRLGRPPRLVIVSCAPNFETQKYLALKQKKADMVGIETRLVVLGETSTTEEFVHAIHSALPIADGVIVQLPLPLTVDKEVIVQAVPPVYDVDALNSNTTEILSPVVCAIQEILTQNEINPVDAQVTILGSGKLVGLPAYRWFVAHGSHVSLVTSDTSDVVHYTKNADIIVCGAGVPGLLTPDMITEGVVIIDAGTSEDGGELRGDAHPDCALKARLFTPVPGGVGPLTIAMLLRNVVDCAEYHNPMV